MTKPHIWVVLKYGGDKWHCMRPPKDGRDFLRHGTMEWAGNGKTPLEAYVNWQRGNRIVA